MSKMRRRFEYSVGPCDFDLSAQEWGVSYAREGSKNISYKFEVNTSFHLRLIDPNGTDKRTDRQKIPLRNRPRPLVGRLGYRKRKTEGSESH